MVIPNRLLLKYVSIFLARRAMPKIEKYLNRVVFLNSRESFFFSGQTLQNMPPSNWAGAQSDQLQCVHQLLRSESGVGAGPELVARDAADLVVALRHQL